MAVSALPLVFAAALRLARGRWRTGPVACLVVGTAVFSGSHNITLLWGSTLAVVALAFYWLLSGASRELPWRRMLGVAGLVAVGVGLNGWFLLTDVRHAHDTIISAEHTPWSLTSQFDSAAVIFDPLRTVPRQSGTPALYVQAPVLALAWGLIVAPFSWRDRGLRPGLATALIVLGGVLILSMSSGAYTLLPAVFQRVQFPYRLQTYVALACAGLVLVGALALTRRSETGLATGSDRGISFGLALVISFGIALCAWQLWVPHTHQAISYSNRAQALGGLPTLLPRSWYAGNDFGDRSAPVIASTEEFQFQAVHVADDRLTASFALPSGPQPFATNIAGGQYLVHVAGGVRVLGRNPSGDLVLERTMGGSQPVRVELSPRLSPAVVLGRIMTVASAALLMAWAVAAWVRRRRRSAP
jgi:hypothetical protein